MILRDIYFLYMQSYYCKIVNDKNSPEKEMKKSLSHADSSHFYDPHVRVYLFQRLIFTPVHSIVNVKSITLYSL